MNGKLYGVGVGPGDPRLLTLLAVETLQKADIIVVPNSGSEGAAQKIVADYVEGKPQMLCEMPMTRDDAVLQQAHEAAADSICSELQKGKNLAFITLGDPTVYSTYMYVHRLVEARGYAVEIVNGISSFCAAAARLGISLCDRDEALHIIPSSYAGAGELLDLPGNKVLMKSGRQIKGILELLREKKLSQNSKMISCCFMDNEKIHNTIDEVESSSYFSIIIVKGESQ